MTDRNLQAEVAQSDALDRFERDLFGPALTIVVAATGVCLVLLLALVLMLLTGGEVR